MGDDELRDEIAAADHRAEHYAMTGSTVCWCADEGAVPQHARVEAGARALWENQGSHIDWDHLAEATREGMRVLARAVLTAAQEPAP